VKWWKVPLNSFCILSHFEINSIKKPDYRHNRYAGKGLRRDKLKECMLGVVLS
jgi:hypothetical protein